MQCKLACSLPSRVGSRRSQVALGLLKLDMVFRLPQLRQLPQISILNLFHTSINQLLPVPTPHSFSSAKIRLFRHIEEGFILKPAFQGLLPAILSSLYPYSMQNSKMLHVNRKKNSSLFILHSSLAKHIFPRLTFNILTTKACSPPQADLCRNDQSDDCAYQCKTDAEPSVSAVLARALPRREPMEQREESRARSGYPESRQRKSSLKPDFLEPTPSAEADSPIFLSSMPMESFPMYTVSILVTVTVSTRLRLRFAFPPPCKA